MWRMRGRWKRSQASDFPGHTAGGGSACQLRGRGFDPWSGRIPHTVGNKAHAPQLLKPGSGACEPQLLSQCTETPVARAPRACGKARETTTGVPRMLRPSVPPPSTPRESQYCSYRSYCSRGSQGKHAEAVCHSLLQWTTFCRPLHHDLSVLAGPTRHGSSFH